ncbi:MAG: alpha/beta hydrolase [Acidimicrobiia bacterium]|nr:alpha/beta hydrolase [Acidimicrobiia bacterium]
MNEAAYRAAEAVLWEAVGMTPEERTIRLATTETQIRIQEFGAGPTVLLLHGSPSSGTGWAHLVPHLRNHRVVVVDLPGTGLSEPLQPAIDMDTYLGRVAVDCLDALGREDALVVGSSSGGTLALKAAAEYPDRISGVVLMGTPWLLEELGTPAGERLMLLPGVGRLLGRMRPGAKMQRRMWRSIGHGSSLDEGRLDQTYLDWWGALLEHTDSLRNDMALMGSLRGRPGSYAPEYLLGPSQRARISAPTVVVWGEHETNGDVPVAEALVASIPNARLELIEGGGHLPWIDAPERAAALVDELVAT